MPSRLLPEHAPMDAGETWLEVGHLADIPALGARVVRTGNGDIALFRTAEDEVYALADRCPHKGGPLSQGIVFGGRVACPLHDWVVELKTGNAVAPDMGCTATYAVRIEDGIVWLNLAVARAGVALACGGVDANTGKEGRV